MNSMYVLTIFSHPNDHDDNIDPHWNSNAWKNIFYTQDIERKSEKKLLEE